VKVPSATLLLELGTWMLYAKGLRSASGEVRSGKS
jgi:hypothetical protein